MFTNEQITELHKGKLSIICQSDDLKDSFQEILNDPVNLNNVYAHIALTTNLLDNLVESHLLLLDTMIKYSKDNSGEQK